MIKTASICLLLLSSLSACSTIATGTSQAINIITPDAEGANCKLNDSKGGKWYVRDTPDSATVTKGDGPMVVTCKKPGFKTTTLTVEETFAGATLGNILLGGGIGIAVDAMSGAAQEYPSTVKVWMQPTKFESDNAKESWFAAKAQREADAAAKKEESSAPRNRRKN